MFDTNPAAEISLIDYSTDFSYAMLREDLLHPEVSGNKWRKLKYNFLDMKANGYGKLVTFGGAYSNHIAATAACAKVHGFESIGIIRGEELSSDSNHTLKFASECGMQLIFVSRSAYRQKTDHGFLQAYLGNPEDYYLIPEGGTNKLAVRGTEEILGSHTDKFNVICVSAGTGGTAAGIINSAAAHQKVLVFPALKGSFMKQEIENMTRTDKIYGKDWEIIDRYHFGGYARWNIKLINFINGFKNRHQIPLDHIYNGKMIFGIHDLLENDYFSDYTSLLAVHTGGIQSTRGFNESNGNLLK